MSEDKKSVFHKRFIQMQSEIKNPALNKTNPHFGNKYTDLASLLDTAREACSKHGLGFVQLLVEKEGKIFLKTQVFDQDQDCFYESEMPLILPNNATMQSLGSAITYAKRYQLQSLIGIAGEEDDDGNQVSEKTEKKSVPNHAPQQRISVTELVREAAKRKQMDETNPLRSNSDEILNVDKLDPDQRREFDEIKAYSPTFGKYRGKGFDEVNLSDLLNYAGWIESNSNETGKPPSDAAQTFIYNVRRYAQLRSFCLPDRYSIDQDKFDPNEEIPF